MGCSDNAGEVALSNTSVTVRVADGGSSVVKLTGLDDPSTVDLRLNCSSGAGQVALYVFAEYPLAHVAYGAPPEIGALAAIELLDCSTERTYCFDSAPDGVGSSDPWFGTGARCSTRTRTTRLLRRRGFRVRRHVLRLRRPRADGLVEEALRRADQMPDSFGTVYDHFTSAYVVVAPVAPRRYRRLCRRLRLPCARAPVTVKRAIIGSTPVIRVKTWRRRTTASAPVVPLALRRRDRRRYRRRFRRPRPGRRARRFLWRRK